MSSLYIALDSDFFIFESEMATGDSYSQFHSSDLDVTQESIKTNGSGMSHSNGSVSFQLHQTKLFVRSYDDALVVDDLWQMFSLYGEVSNIIISAAW